MIAAWTRSRKTPGLRRGPVPPARRWRMALDPRFRVGELRPSQLLFVSGVGGIVDLRYVSVMVMGLDDWELTACHPLSEPRLLQAVQRRLPSVTNLRMPPVLADDTSFNPNPVSDSP